MSGPDILPFAKCTPKKYPPGRGLISVPDMSGTEAIASRAQVASGILSNVAVHTMERILLTAPQPAKAGNTTSKRADEKSKPFAVPFAMLSHMLAGETTYHACEPFLHATIYLAQ